MRCMPSTMPKIRRVALAAALTLLALAASAATAETISPGLSVERLEEGVFLVVHAYPWASNSLLAVMRDGRLLMIDTPSTPKATGELLAWASSKLGERDVVAVTTHFHVDRLGGNAELARRGIPIYGSTLTPKAIAERGASSLKGLAAMIPDPKVRSYYETFKYVPPTRLFDPRAGLVLDFGGEEARIEYPGVGHSVDNLVVYLPDRRLLFGGCMILAMETGSVGNVADGDVPRWIGSLAFVEAGDCDIVVPGHGRPGGPGLVAHTGEVLQSSLGR
jgi:metallo-beta-lactamase class B